LEQLHEQTKKIAYGSPYFNYCLEYPLGAFTLPEISELLDRAGDHFNQRDREFIITVSGRHPYLAQAAAATLWEAHVDGLKGMARYRTAALELYRETERHFADTWRLWQNEFRIVIATVALTQIPRLVAQPNLLEIGLLDDLAKYSPELVKLERVGIVTHHDGNGWNIAQNAFLWWLVDELQRAIRQDNSDFKDWLDKPQMAVMPKHQEQETIKSAVKKVLAALDKGAMALIDALVKKFVE